MLERMGFSLSCAYIVRHERSSLEEELEMSEFQVDRPSLADSGRLEHAVWLVLFFSWRRRDLRGGVDPAL